MSRSIRIIGLALFACFVCSACTEYRRVEVTLDSSGDIRIDGEVVDGQNIRDHFERLDDEHPISIVAFSPEFLGEDYQFVMDAASDSGLTISIVIHATQVE